MNLDEIITQIQAGVTDLRLVAGSIELAAAQADTRTTPAAYVLAATESSQENSLSAGAVSQVVSATFSVVIAVANYQDASGKAGHDALQALRGDLMTALVGWQPASATDVVTHVQGSLALYNDSTLWWEDIFRTEFLRRAT